MAKLMLSITHARDNTDKATVGFVVANASGRLRRGDGGIPQHGRRVSFTERLRR